jgi:1-acyl-sn-glycerol-3-phosphate acyltransferase
VSGEYRVSPWLTVKRQIIRYSIRFLIMLLFRVKIYGRDNIPLGTAYLIAINHPSYYEPALALSHWPEVSEAVAGHDVWERGLNGKVVAAFGSIPVKRGEYDRRVLDTMNAVLASGRPLFIAPEGNRSNQPGMKRAKAGVAYVVDRADVPVVPVAVKGTSNDSLKEALKLKRPTLEMYIGKPFKLPPIIGKGKERREARQHAADEVMLRIASMLPEEYHGVYAGQVSDFPAS